MLVKLPEGMIMHEVPFVQRITRNRDGRAPHCFSTLGYNVAYCYSTARVMKWLFKQARHGFQGGTASFE